MPTLGLSMIVKNGGDELRQCLASAAPFVSQIVIADTGSTDHSREIAREFGATLVDFPWVNDFAAARNAALAPMTTDWILMLDADEEIDPAAGELLPSLLANPRVGGWVMPIRNYVPVRFTRMFNSNSLPNDGRVARAASAPAYTVHTNVRLFRRHSEIYFEGQVHETVGGRVPVSGFELGNAELIVHHFGQLASEEVRGGKNQFYLELGRAKVARYPNSPMAWLELGLQEFEGFQNHTEAVRCFTRALQLKPDLYDGWIFLALVERELGHHAQALQALERAGNGPHGAALREQLRGDLLHDLGQLTEARAAYRKALKFDPRSAVLESKLGYTEVRLGMKQSGFAKLERALAAAADQPECYDRLVKAFVAVDDAPGAALAAERFAEAFPAPKTILRAAGIRAHLKEYARAEALIASGVLKFPESEELRAALAQLRSA